MINLLTSLFCIQQKYLYNPRISFVIFATKFYEEITFFISCLLSTSILLGYYVGKHAENEMRNEKA